MVNVVPWDLPRHNIHHDTSFFLFQIMSQCEAFRLLCAICTMLILALTKLDCGSLSARENFSLEGE